MGERTHPVLGLTLQPHHGPKPCMLQNPGSVSWVQRAGLSCCCCFRECVQS